LTIREIPQEVAPGKKEGLRRLSVADMEKLHLIPKSLLADPIGVVGADREAEIQSALGYALDWPELKMI
jgi:mRNA-degrading endonuclease toxin of MazEF toxin-antitoxin module